MALFWDLPALPYETMDSVRQGEQQRSSPPHKDYRTEEASMTTHIKSDTYALCFLILSKTNVSLGRDRRLTWLNEMELGWRWGAEWLAQGAARAEVAAPGVISANGLAKSSQLINQVMHSAGLLPGAVSRVFSRQLSATPWPIRTNALLNVWLHRINQN